MITFQRTKGNVGASFISSVGTSLVCVQWVQGLAASPPGASNKCDGQLLNETQWGKGVAYCALEMANKTFSSPMLNGL